jgi:polyisoprenyl-phosphate glycosyltransferase
MSLAIKTEMDAVVSIIVPVRDGQAFVSGVIQGIDHVVRGLFRHYEIVVVDDGSRDGTVEIIEKLQQTVANLQLYCLNTRSGLDVALTAGLDGSIGDFVITLNPETDSVDLIPSLWEKAEQGNEFVCGVWRVGARPRKHAIRRRLFRRVFEASTGLRIPPDATQFRLYSRRIVAYMIKSNDRHLMLGVLPFFNLHRAATFEYTPVNLGNSFHDDSLIGGLIRATSILLASSARPLRLLTVMALLASFLSLLFAGWVMGVAIFKHNVVEGWISLALPMAVIFFLMSTMLGVISEYLYMLAQHSGNRPVYSIVKESTSSIIHARAALNVVDNRGPRAE